MAEGTIMMVKAFAVNAKQKQNDYLIISGD
jgi:hypothetical protein